jgi:23S rRNA pseudouridine2605 synthase
MVKERLQKLLSRAGIGSRRACEQLILDGHVLINGEPVNSLPVLVDPGEDRVCIDGKPVAITPERKIYVMLNKPNGVVCTARDEQGRKTVLDLLPAGAIRERVFPVGRLDKDSQGLLLLTNDGELTKKLTHPSYGVERVYQTEVAAHVDGTVVEKLLKGVWLAEGKATMSRIKIVKRGSTSSLLEITLRESKNRQVRRMFAKLGIPVRKLTRIRMGPLELKGIGVGRARRLTPAELKELKELVNETP